jgi:hypothetical protein
LAIIAETNAEIERGQPVQGVDGPDGGIEVWVVSNMTGE